jgi:predicted AAA+ superfamily ATPase
MAAPNVISFDAVAKALGSISRPTVEKYIHYLEIGNLLYTSKPIELSGRKILKSQPKIYVTDASIRNIMVSHDELLADSELMDAIVETTIYKHIRSFYAGNPKVELGYYRSPGPRSKGIDIVISGPRDRIFVDVNYRETYRLGPDQPSWALSSEAASCLIITKRDDDFGLLQAGPDKIYRIPAPAFLYLLGHAEKNGYHLNGSI